MVQATRSRSAAKTYSADLSPEVEWYLADRGYKITPLQRPLWRTKEPRTVRGAYFDPARVDKVIDALKRMRHTQGKWAGHPLTPDPWQVAYIIAPIFGWVKRDTFGRVLRIIRSVWVEVPRKNGKTTIAAGIGLYLAFGDGESGAQVIAAAASKNQAMNAYRPAKLIAKNSPDFQAAGIKAMQKEIVREVDQSFMMAVGSIGDLLQGTNPNGYIADEMHVHKDMSVIDALESGTGARDQPLGFIITTADDGGQLTPYAQKRATVEQLCRGAIKSPSEYAVIFAAPEGSDPHAEETHRMANPGYGISPTKAFMDAESQKAKASPANLARFSRLNLNVRTKQETKYIDLHAWDRNQGLISELSLKGEECYGGLDLASVSDLSSLCLLFPQSDGSYKAIWRYWTPEDNVRALDKRTNGAASQWVKDGWLTVTPGNVQDYDYIRTQIGLDSEKFRILSIGFDPFNASQLTNDLAADGMNLVKVRQGFLTLSPPTKMLQRLVLMGKPSKPMMMHGGNPVTRWCVDNLGVEIDAAENVKPSKKKSGDKIDGVAALVDALSEAMNEEILQSAYDEEHSLIIA
ncbi:terminase large subunit [Cryobacterium sp. AP23]